MCNHDTHKSKSISDLKFSIWAVYRNDIELSKAGALLYRIDIRDLSRKSKICSRGTEIKEEVSMD